MMFLTVLLLGYLAVLQLTAAYPYESEKSRVPSRLQGMGKIENDGGGEENTVCIIYKDSGEKECHPIGKYNMLFVLLLLDFEIAYTVYLRLYLCSLQAIF